MKTKLIKKQSLIIASGVFAVLIVAAIISFVFFFNPQRTFTITETYKITSASGSETYLNVGLSESGGYQEITDFLVDGVDDYTIEDYDGWRELTALIPSNDSEVVIVISYTVKLNRNAEPWDGEDLDEYVLPQQYVDSDNAEIIKLSEQLRGTDDYETAQNILNYVYKTIKARSETLVNATQLTASELLETPVGVCADKAILMTALLRADGIPARKISGLVLSVPLKKVVDWSHPGGSHAWVEFYADGEWHFADPTWNIFDKSDTTHLSYGTYETSMNSDFLQNRYNEIKKAGFFLNGSMSAPLRFTVYSTDENATVIPRADATFSWFR